MIIFILLDVIFHNLQRWQSTRLKIVHDRMMSISPDLWLVKAGDNFLLSGWIIDELLRVNITLNVIRVKIFHTERIIFSVWIRKKWIVKLKALESQLAALLRWFTFVPFDQYWVLRNNNYVSCFVNLFWIDILIMILSVPTHPWMPQARIVNLTDCL